MTDRTTPADILIGHSWGGAAVIAAAMQSPGVRSVVTVAAPVDPSHVEKHYDAVVERVFSEGTAEWMVGGRTLTLKRAFVEDVRAAHLHAKIKSLRLPLLILHSPTDNTVGIENASEIFRLARHPRSFVSLEGSDHLLTARGQAHRAGRISAPGPTHTSGIQVSRCLGNSIRKKAADIVDMAPLGWFI